MTDVGSVDFGLSSDIKMTDLDFDLVVDSTMCATTPTLTSTLTPTFTLKLTLALTLTLASTRRCAIAWWIRPVGKCNSRLCDCRSRWADGMGRAGLMGRAGAQVEDDPDRRAAGDDDVRGILLWLHQGLASELQLQPE